MKINKIIIPFLALAFLLNSCYVSKDARMNSWISKSLNDLIEQSGFPDNIYYEYDTIQQANVTLLIYKKKRIKKFNYYFESEITKQELDSIIHYFSDTTEIAKIYGTRSTSLIKQWKTYDFGINGKMEIVSTGYTGF